MPCQVGLDGDHVGLHTRQLRLVRVVFFQAKRAQLYLQCRSFETLVLEIGFHKFA